MPAIKGKPTLCIDFDGVIHDYKAGWQGGEIYGDVVPGFFGWCVEASKFFVLAVYSSRSKDDRMRSDMSHWLSKKLLEWWDLQPGSEELPVPFQFNIVADKPAAWLTIDDRCIRFDGDWTDECFRPENLLAFKPWTTRPPVVKRVKSQTVS